jgi:acetyl-CoA carboxylase biotin carboxyl carrier protein
MTLSNEDVNEIVRLLDDLDAAELRVRTRHYTVHLRRDRAGGEWRQATSVGSTPRMVEAPDAEPVAVPQAAAHRDTAEPQRDTAGLLPVRAPLMGTFYRAPKPGAPPYVEVGTSVREDSVVGIVETMKLMNSVHAGVRGRVVEICLDNDQFAEQGAILMLVGPEQE